ncbi:MAG: transcription antitermination factor NusB, partial [Candidatus Heimdallarchaeaceae archaeon]
MESLIPIIVSTLTEIESGKSIRVALRNSISVHQLDREQESILYHLVFEIHRKLNVIDLYVKSSSSSFSLKKISDENRALLRIATFLLKIDQNS